MTINEIVGKIMVALDEVSSTVITANKDEYMPKIYPILDTIQTEIATLVKPIKKYSTVASANLRIPMPTDCFEFLKVYDTDLSPVRFMIFDNNIILNDERLVDNNYTLLYHKYPTTINSSNPDSYALEIDKDCQEALVYGVCAGLTINDEPELYNTYSERYNTMLVNITERMQKNTTATLVGGLRI